jgi:hypothetical protein
MRQIAPRLATAALVLGIGMHLAGCEWPEEKPRTLQWNSEKEIRRAYADYRWLESSGRQELTVENSVVEEKISLAFYLFKIAEALERVGRGRDAEKLYLRLLLRHTALQADNQLGVMAENRLRWLIGDKSWVAPAADILVQRLESALRSKNFRMLEKLLSRDFGIGRTLDNRFFLPYPEAIQLIEKNFQNAGPIVVEVIDEIPNEKMLLKTTGWDHGKRAWYLGLYHNRQAKGWEWNLAYWENP